MNLRYHHTTEFVLYHNPSILILFPYYIYLFLFYCSWRITSYLIISFYSRNPVRVINGKFLFLNNQTPDSLQWQLSLQFIIKTVLCIVYFYFADSHESAERVQNILIKSRPGKCFQPIHTSDMFNIIGKFFVFIITFHFAYCYSRLHLEWKCH